MDNFFKLANAEYVMARRKYKPFNSTHEGWAVIQEEVDELWDMIKASKKTRIDNPRMVNECIQIAAMAYAFVKDLGDK